MSKPFILILEDNFIIADATCRMLETAGYRVAMAHSAEAALILARLDAPKLAIVDLSLKDGMTGVEAARQLRALGCAVVVCTGFDGALAESWARQIGAVDVLTKPVSPADMLEAVAGALGTATEHRARRSSPGEWLSGPRRGGGESGRRLP